MNEAGSKQQQGKTSKGKSNWGGWIFLGAVVGAYLLVFLVKPSLADKSWQASLHLTATIAPILLIVYALMLLSNLLVRESLIRRYVGQTSGWLGYLVATVTGILSTGPIYVWYPLLADLRRKGMKDSLMAVFLYNRAIKLPWLALMIGFFGGKYTLVLTLWTMLAGIVEGVAIELRFDRK